MFVKRLLACALLIAVPGFARAGAAETGTGCKSENLAVAIPACTALIEAGGAEAGPAYFDRGRAYVAQFYADKQAVEEDARNCIHNAEEASLAACNRVIDNPAVDTHLRESAFFYRSKLLSAAGKGDESMADFQRSLGTPATAPAEKAPSAAGKAIADFSKAIELDPNNAAAFAQRGDTYLALENVKASLADFEQAIKIDSKQMVALIGRAVIRNGTGDPVGAVADFKAIIALPAITEQEKWMQNVAKERLQAVGAD